MTNVISLETSYPVELVTRALARISAQESYKRSIICLPNNSSAGVIMILPDDASDTRRVVLRTAIELDARAVCEDGSEAFVTDDNDTFFIDRMPTPEEEVRQIILRAEITNIRDVNLVEERLIALVAASGYKYAKPDGGYSIYMNSTVILDIYYERGDDELIAEFDATYSGAGYFAEAYNFTSNLVRMLGGDVKYYSDDEITYCEDGNFEKLRQLFYKLIRQQLAYAVADDQDGLQAYIGWSGDTYEPEIIAGTVVSCFGRYELERVKTEIAQWGLEAVADHHFLFRNHLIRDNSDNLKEALIHLWCDVSERREQSRRHAFYDGDYMEGDGGITELTMDILEDLLNDDTAIPFPYASFGELMTLMKRTLKKEPPTHPNYVSHYPIGFLKTDVSYGFGSYLRHFVLPGGFYPFEYVEGESMDLVLAGGKKGKRHADIEVLIRYNGLELNVDKRFYMIPNDVEWFECDIGGSATCRYCAFTAWSRYGDKTKFVTAEIHIRDEEYLLQLTTADQNFADYFVEAIKNCRAVEEVDDIVMPNPEERPRAWGATYFKPLYFDAKDDGYYFERLEPIIGEHLDSVYTVWPLPDLTTDINSKVGGQPYLPPDVEAEADPRNSGLDYAFQINFSECNSKGMIPELPTSGLLQLWVRGLEEVTKATSSRIYSGGDLRFVWYPEPKGGYVTETCGTQLKFIRDTTFPSGGTEKHRKLHEFITKEFPEWSFDMREIANRFTINGQRLGGRIAYTDYPAPILRELYNEDFTIIKLKLNHGNGDERLVNRMELVIDREELKRLNFSAARLLVYKTTRNDTTVYFEDDEKYDFSNDVKLDRHQCLIDLLEQQFIAALRSYCERSSENCEWLLRKSDEEILYRVTHDESGKYRRLMGRIGFPLGSIKNLVKNYDCLGEKFGEDDAEDDSNKHVQLPHQFSKRDIIRLLIDSGLLDSGEPQKNEGETESEEKDILQPYDYYDGTDDDDGEND